MNNPETSRQSVADDVIGEVQSLLERLKLYVKDEGGFSNYTQHHNINYCISLLKAALRQDRSPHVTGIKSSIGKEHPDYVAHAWIEGRSEELEEALSKKSYEECKRIEDRAVKLLQEEKSEWAWEYHHKRLSLHVLERKEKNKVRKELSKLPKKVRSSLVLFKPFKRGDRFGSRQYHDFTSRQKVLVRNGTGKRKYGYVCHETKEFITMIDSNGDEFKKKKHNVEKIHHWRLNF